MPVDGKLSHVAEERGGSFQSSWIQWIRASRRWALRIQTLDVRAVINWSLILILSLMKDIMIRWGLWPAPSWFVPSKKSGSTSTASLMVEMGLLGTGAKLEDHKADTHLGGEYGKEGIELPMVKFQLHHAQAHSQKHHHEGNWLAHRQLQHCPPCQLLFLQQHSWWRGMTGNLTR